MLAGSIGALRRAHTIPAHQLARLRWRVALLPLLGLVQVAIVVGESVGTHVCLLSVSSCIESIFFQYVISGGSGLVVVDRKGL